MAETKIYQYLDKMRDKRIRAIGRASNMLWLGIGEKVIMLDRRGKEVEKSTFSLHVQSTWRIVDVEKRKILLASSDFYSPKDSAIFDKNFQWDVQGNNLFDTKAVAWLQKAAPVSIENYKLNRWGDLLLVLSNGERIEIYVDASDNTECWRIFEVNRESKHLVMTGLGMSFD